MIPVNFLKTFSTTFAKVSLLFLFWGLNTFCFDDYGLESYRFHIFNGDVSGMKFNKPFYYTLNFLNGDINDLKTAGVDENLVEWVNYFGKKVTKKDIRSVLYDGYYYGSIDETTGILDSKSLLDNNLSFGKIQRSNPEAFDYMMFAKRCEYFLRNEMVDNYQWFSSEDEERVRAQEAKFRVQREKLFTEVIKTLPAVKDPFIKMRYAYQAIVLSRYNEDYKETASVYKKYFENNSDISVIKYWALLHYAEKCVNESSLKDFYLALIAKNSLAKRYRTYLLFEHTKPEKLLTLAKTPKEKAAIWYQDALHNPGRAMNAIEAISKLDPNDKDLPFLMSREINKIEHWLYTNKLTNASLDYYDYIKDIDIKQNLEDDKKYASGILQLAQRCASDPKVINKSFWNLAAGHLNLLQDKIPAALDNLKTALEQSPTIDQYRQIKTTRLLCFVLDNNSNAITEEKLYQDLIDLMNVERKAKNKWIDYTQEGDMERDYSSTDQLLTLVAYKFEQSGQVAKSALILSLCHDLLRIQEKFVTFWNHYDDYFFYLDELARPEDVKYVLDLIDKKDKSNFEALLTSKVVFDKYKLMDLYGTMLLRQEKYLEASAVWNKVPEEYWGSGIFEYGYYMSSNPFYADFYSGHAMTVADTIQYTKAEIINKIISLQKSAVNDVSGRDYFTLGNAAYNMSHHGNSWMMVRYGWSTHEIANDEAFTPRSDEKNYYDLELAMSYYKKASSVAKDKNFAALCLRMAIKCDEFRQMTKGPRNYGQDSQVYVSSFRKELENKDAKLFDEMINDCGSFFEYIK